MFSLKALNASFRQFAIQHAMIHSYGFGDTFNMTASMLQFNTLNDTGSIHYPIMWVVPTQSTIERRLFKMNYKILIADVILDDMSNIDAALSDTAQTAHDFLSYLVQTAGQMPEAFFIDNTFSYTLTPFIDDSAGMFPDKLVGWNLEMVLNMIRNNDTTSIPFLS